jgi:large subunit ribosomal protein L24
MGRHVRKGDVVAVIAGKYKGRQGKILEVLTEKERVRVEGIATIKRHLKPGRDPKVPEGGIIEKFGTVHISNVLPLDPSSGKPTRVGHKTLTDGRKVRVARRSGETLRDAG